MNDELQAAADEELQAALGLSWAALAKLVPWGDSYVGLAPGGREVEIERGYLWATEPGGDILVEVKVFAGQTRYDQGGHATAVIKRA